MDPTICTRVQEHPAWALKKNDRIIANNEECTFLNLSWPIRTFPIKKLFIQTLQHEKPIGFMVNVEDPFQVSDQTLTFINPVKFRK
jgi:hypothetical protein